MKTIVKLSSVLLTIFLASGTVFSAIDNAFDNPLHMLANVCVAESKKRKITPEIEEPLSMYVRTADRQKRGAFVEYYCRNPNNNHVRKKLTAQLTAEELLQATEIWRKMALGSQSKRTYLENLELTWIREKRQADRKGKTIPPLSDMLYTDGE